MEESRQKRENSGETSRKGEDCVFQKTVTFQAADAENGN